MNQNNVSAFKLIDPSFQSINCGGWFYFGDFDNDNQLELMTQSIVNPTHISYYENGQKETEGTFKDGKENGLFIEWYENGQKKEEEN